MATHPPTQLSDSPGLRHSSEAAADSESLPRKRARTLELCGHDDQDVLNNSKPDEEFWLEDGNIVLLLGTDKFRIYRGVLAEHSPVFAETFSLPQPADGASAETPGTVIRLYDHPEDFRQLLRLLLPRRTAPFAPREAPTFDMVSAYVRLAHKYQMDALLTEWMEYLADHFTSQFNQWTAHSSQVPEGFDGIHVVGVVNLARLTGYTSILPTALAVCSMLGARIVGGFTRADGVREQLSPEDLGRCFKARGEIIQRNAMASMIALAHEPNHDCSGPSVCADSIRRLLEFFRSRSQIDVVAPQQLAPSWQRYASMTTAYDVCHVCQSCMENAYITESKAIWRELPRVVGLRIKGWGKET
ncbi:hypothetical protein C8Q76DRAFT_685852 [Earliella scabrosa]|nr:hypothetical protein C8Q76DRAFT_685852 [Earliella scabrosa]